MTINKYLKEKMYSAGGYRERYAMDHGKPQFFNGDTCIKFTYSSDLEYQDANGATYNIKRKTWIN